MRVLIAHDYGTLHGGAELVSNALRTGLRARGHEAILFASSARNLPIDNVADTTCWGTMGPARKVLQVANPFARVALERTLRSFRPDVVHLRMFMTQLSPWILPVLKDVPTVHHVVNYDLVCPLNVKRLPDGSPCHNRAGVACHQAGCMPWIGVMRSLMQQRLTRSGLKHVDRIVCNSHWVRRRIEDEGFPVSAVIWNGIPDRPARRQMAAEPLVVFGGRLVPKKGVDLLINAVSVLKREVPNLRVIISGDGPERSALEELSDASDTRDVIEFTGHISRDRMEDMFAPAWVQVVPSKWEEPFGLVVAEAQMRGTAVVASDIGGPAEIIDHGETGLHFAVGNVDSLIVALRQLLLDRETADRMGQRGRERAMANFRERTMVDKFIELYGTMLTGTRHSN